jgi:hypothetical protein
VNKGELDRAKRRALTIFDDWQRMTGALDGTSWLWEVESIIADAVEIGVQAALGIHTPLAVELDKE